MNVEILDDVAGAVAELMVKYATAGLDIVLTGGSTPGVAYERAAELSDRGLWSESVLWFGDDRAVGPDDDRSNYKLAKETLLDHVDARVERIEGELGPEEAARKYAERLEVHYPGKAIPEFDLILLGLGSDGHCGSIFPGKPALGVRDRAVVGVPEAGLEPFVPRVTMTLPVFNAGREVVFMVTGEGKAEAAARAFGGEPRDDTPASFVRPPGLRVLMDPAAASLLSK